MKHNPLVILHMGMMKTASTFLQRSYWQNFRGNCGKPLDNKTADLALRLQLVIDRLESNDSEVKVVSDEALLMGGEVNEQYKSELLSYLGDANVVPMVVTQRPSRLLNSAIAYFARGRVFPNFEETARNLTHRFPKLLDYLDVPRLERSLVESIGDPILVDINHIAEMHSILENRLGRDLSLEIPLKGGPHSYRAVNQSSLSRKLWTHSVRRKSSLFESMPEADLVRNLDETYATWISKQNY